MKSSAQGGVWLNKDKLFLDTYRLVVYLLILNTILFIFVCYFFWIATTNLSNAIDSSPGLPLIFDIGLSFGILLNVLVTRYMVKWIIMLKPDAESIWRAKESDSKWRAIPGPPISKTYPTNRPKQAPREFHSQD